MNDTMPVTNISGQNLLLNIHDFDFVSSVSRSLQETDGRAEYYSSGVWPGSESRGKHTGNFLPEYLR